MDVEKEIAKLQRDVSKAFNEARYEDALQAATTCLSTVQDHYGEKHPVTASCFNNLGLIHKTLGDLDRSVLYYERAVNIYDSVVGEEHPSAATAFTNLAIVQRMKVETAAGLDKTLQRDLALEYAEEAVRRQKLAHGEGHPKAAAATFNLASVLRGAGRVDDAAAMLRTAEQYLAQELGMKHLLVATAMNNLALTLKSRGAPQDLEQAREKYEQAHAVREELLGISHPETIAVLHNMAELADARGDAAEAERLRRRIMDLLGVEEAEGGEASGGASRGAQEAV